mgnify:CR=1 FL=1
MYIGKVLLSDEWEKLEDLIQEQVSGQSAFTFDSTKTYQLQGECDHEALKENLLATRLCEVTSASSLADDDGFCISHNQCADYIPSTGSVYVRVDLTEKPGQPNFGKMYLKISTMGE